MEIENTFIKDLKIIKTNKIDDMRGNFTKVFNYDVFVRENLKSNFKESYFSISSVDVIRGMHFQIPPMEHTKLVYVNQGAIIDVALDIRENSETFRKYFKIELSSNNGYCMYIPDGFAHGFLSLEDTTIVTYLQTSVYSPVHDKGIKYDSFNFPWPCETPIISERDQNFPSFETFFK